MELVLGLDGGGSKTLAAVVDRGGNVVRLERSTGLDPLSYPHWAASLRELAERLKEECEGVRAGVFGLPVHGEIASVSAEQDAIARSVFGETGVADNDVRVAFDGALGGDGGVLLLAGTGSMAWASAGGPDAAQVRVGGWGEAFGDEGSAFWIAREALTETSRVLDGRSEAETFAQGIMAAAGIDGDGLLMWAYGLENRRRGFAALARTVSSLAEAGDAAANAILDRAAAQLAEHGKTAWRRTGSNKPFVWTCAGGAFRSQPLRSKVGALLGAPPRALRLPPVGGAVLRAAQLLGWPMDAAWIDKLAGSLAAHPALDQQKGEFA